MRLSSSSPPPLRFFSNGSSCERKTDGGAQQSREPGRSTRYIGREAVKAGYIEVAGCAGTFRPHIQRMRTLELRVPPLALVIVFAILMMLLAQMVPGADYSVPAQPLPAIGVAVLGAAAVVAGVVAFRRHKTTVNPFTPDQTSSLVTSGIYRFTRNPMYLGFLLVLAGWSLYLANWVAVLLLPVFVVYMNRFQIEPEERALREKFGQSFIEYMSAVRRWL